MAATSDKNVKNGASATLDCRESWLDATIQGSALSSLTEENRSLKIKIAGVETLSSLLRGTQGELETICAEKESLEMELSRLQCRCSLLEKDLESAKKAPQMAVGQPKNMFEALLKENKKLKNELKHARNVGKHKESIFGADAMAELLTFKGELETEIRQLQRAMNGNDEESSISQISRLLGQVTKLEYEQKEKDEQCQALKRELDSLKMQLAAAEKTGGKDVPFSNKNDLAKESKLDFETQFASKGTDVTTQTEAPEESQVAEHGKSTIQKNPSHEVVLLRNSGSFRRKNSKRVSGDWSQIRKVHSEFFEDEWNMDSINTAEQLKVTQDLLVQANEIIMTMTEENEKLLKVNAMLLQDIAHGENIQLHEKDRILDRFRFLFSETSFEEHFDEIEVIQDILIAGDLDSENIGNIQDEETTKTKDAEVLTMQDTENVKTQAAKNAIVHDFDIGKAVDSEDAKTKNAEILTMQGAKGEVTQTADVKCMQNLETAIRQDVEVTKTKDAEVITMQDAGDGKMEPAENAKRCDDMIDELNNNVQNIELKEVQEPTSSLEAKDIKVKKEDGSKTPSQTRDSGVDICTTEGEKHCGVQLEVNGFGKEVESEEPLTNHDEMKAENTKLKQEAEAQCKRLAEFEEKICELEEALQTLKNREMQWKKDLDAPKETLQTQRLCKSIGHIPSLTRTSTHRRVVFESDV